MPHSMEDLYRSMQRGLAATGELAVAIPLLAARQKALIAQAINDYDSKLDGRMTEQKALLFVAALAENQHLLNDLESVERIGRRDGEKLAKM